MRRGGAVAEQADRLVIAQARPRLAAAPAGSDSGDTCQTVSAATRSGSRLVASTRRPGELASSRWHRRAHDRSGARSCPAPAAADAAGARRPAYRSAGGPVPPRRRWPTPRADTTSSGWRRSPSSMNQTPSGKSLGQPRQHPQGQPRSCRCRPPRTASRRASRATADAVRRPQRARPTKLLNSSGRLAASHMGHFQSGYRIRRVGRTQAPLLRYRRHRCGHVRRRSIAASRPKAHPSRPEYARYRG